MVENKPQHLGKDEQEYCEVLTHLNAYKRHQIDSPEKGKTFRMVALKLCQSYRKIIQGHLNQYNEEFRKYFANHRDSIVAIDSESISNKLVCITGIILNPDLTFQLTVKVGENIYHLRWNANNLQNEIKDWLKKNTKSNILSHGENGQELQIIQSLGRNQINTQRYLESYKKSPEHKEMVLKGVGLSAFENLIHFERAACKMLKHKILSKTQIRKHFFNAALVSLDKHLWQIPQRICQWCHKSQDVLLYCLEDTFVTTLIYAWAINRGISPWLPKEKKLSQPPLIKKVWGKILTLPMLPYSEMELAHQLEFKTPEEERMLGLCVQVLLQENKIQLIGKKIQRLS